MDSQFSCLLRYIGTQYYQNYQNKVCVTNPEKIINNMNEKLIFRTKLNHTWKIFRETLFCNFVMKTMMFGDNLDNDDDDCDDGDSDNKDNSVI